jgi:predicted nucleotidyltransferase
MDLGWNKKETLNEIKQQLETELGKSLVSLISYSSIAQREFHSDSDIDILLVLEDKKVQDRALDKIFDIDEKNETNTSVFATTPREIEQSLKSGSPFLENLLKEGGVIYDNGAWEKIRGAVLSGMDKSQTSRSPYRKPILGHGLV